MVTRNSNLLLSNAAAPANGVNYGSLVQWFGGDLNVSVTGVFDGATVDLVFCTRLPKLASNQTYADVLTDADWISLSAFTASGKYSGPLNPCLLGVKISSTGTNTRVRAVAG